MASTDQEELANSLFAQLVENAAPTRRPPRSELRERQMLAAAAAQSREELCCGCEPDLLIDEGWCDHVSVHWLVHADLIRGARAGPVSMRVAAMVTEAGHELLRSKTD